MSFKKLLSQMGASLEFGNLILIQSISKTHTKHHAQKNGTTASADDLVLAPDLLIQITENKDLSKPKVSRKSLLNLKKKQNLRHRQS